MCGRDIAGAGDRAMTAASAGRAGRGGAGQPRVGPLLEVDDLHAYFRTRGGLVKAVNGVGFTVDAGASVGIVGESGSGKSVTAYAITGLLETPGYVHRGTMRLRGKDITGLPDREMRHIRGRDIGMVFQEPMAALNPVTRVGHQIAEAVQAHNPVGRKEAMARAVELLRAVGIPAPERRVRDYPGSMSGGMRQRVVIAMAIANDPQLLILDEPTTALDVTVQAQILELVRELRERIGTAVLLITHDVGVIAEVCDEVIVMYGGRVMEHATTAQVVHSPKHPYSIGLLESVPSAGLKGQRLKAISGSVPTPGQMPPGCPFATRCPKAFDKCAQLPPLYRLDDGRQVACWLYE
jgi:oligopeptide/dipeptide ABC transporter ATP-binding protein